MDTVASLRKILFHRAQQAGFAGTRISRHHRRGAAIQRGVQALPRCLQSFRIEHLQGGNILAEWKPRQTVGG